MRNLIAVLIALLLVCGVASALPDVDYVKINGEVYTSGELLEVELGETLDLKIKLTATADEEDVELAADILGYEYNDFARISDATGTFDMVNGTTAFKTLQVTIPENADKDEYDLKVRMGTRTGNDDLLRINLKVMGSRHNVVVKDIFLSPDGVVTAGLSVSADVLLKNYGERDEEGLKVKVSIPELGVSASKYVDEIESGDSLTLDGEDLSPLVLRIPECVEEGVYEVVASVEYDEGYETSKATTSIFVSEGDLCKPVATTETTAKPHTLISVGAVSQDVVVGESGVVYPLTITNAGTTARAYTLTVAGAEWGDVKVTPGKTLLVGADETKAAFIYLSAADATAGQKMFTVTVESSGSMLKQIPLTANVVAKAADAVSWDKVKKGLGIGLFVLLVLLVILGLIIGFNKLKGDDDDFEDEKDRTYY